MLLFLNFFKRKEDKIHPQKTNITSPIQKQKNNQLAIRKGELGEYKIDIQLEQLPKDYLYISDLLVKNPQAKSGYSQIDHVVITTYGIFVIETKNYQGIIYNAG